MTKTLIERNLPFNRQYIYLSITKGNILDGQCTCCDNCGTLIANMVTVKDKESGKTYTIGTDCAETLSKAKCLYNNGNATDFYQDIYEYNTVARFVTEVNAGCELVNDGFQCSLINRKGKSMAVFTHTLTKYFPELIN